MIQPQTLIKSQNILGEGPTWHKERNSLFWVDIEQKLLNEYVVSTQKHNKWTFSFKVTSVSIETLNSVVLTSENAILRYNLSNNSLEYLHEFVDISIDLRLNDSKCDFSGRLWTGTMDKSCQFAKGCLYSFSSNKNISKKLENIVLSNGLAWTADSKTMYYIDSMTYSVKSYQFDLISGSIIFDKICISIPQVLGIPDGMTIDNDGMLWIALWGGFCVARFNPNNGEMLEKLHLPAPNITSCTFGGENGVDLYITSASDSLSSDDLLKYPESGNVFVYKPKIGGAINYYYKTN